MTTPERSEAHVARILVVDDEPSMREFLEIALEDFGYQVRVAENLMTARQCLRENAFEVVLTDLRLPDGTGIELLTEIKAEAESEVILLTAYATAETALEAMKQGAYDYLLKPVKLNELEALLEKAIEKYALRDENRRLSQTLAVVSPKLSETSLSPKMKKVYGLVSKVAIARTTILLRGESGTGKEVIAREIHQQSRVSKGPFIAVNCGAIPESLIESELFGHASGAFTGARNAHEGLFVTADQGTLFLDEIGELPVNMQVKLLRALQERKIRPVGASEEREIDVRIIAATNRDLSGMIREGTFREDLYYRLNVIELELPALRERREDIPHLIKVLLQKCSHKLGLPVPAIEPSALNALNAYDFPGNIRELENIVERATTLCTDELIQLTDLPDDVALSSAPVETFGWTAFQEGGVDLDGRIEKLERALIGEALRRSGGNKTEAAKDLGISFRSLRYRLEKLGLDNVENGEPGAED